MAGFQARLRIFNNTETKVYIYKLVVAFGLSIELLRTSPRMPIISEPIVFSVIFNYLQFISAQAMVRRVNQEDPILSSLLRQESKLYHAVMILLLSL